jgi:UDP-N-acetylmuramate dehydrogenase
MNSKENVPLASHTTFGVGGSARFFVEANTEEEIEEAIAFAREKKMPMFVLGNGSNVLVPDAGVEGVVLKLKNNKIAFESNGDTLLIADAGTQWEQIVDAVTEQNLFGIENLAGIPGTMGGAAVQNIGAYGAELSEVFEYADVVDTKTGDKKRVNKKEVEFAYRTSFFKMHRELIVTRVALSLARQGTPNLNYPDLKGMMIKTPAEIARAIRTIRANKFPMNTEEGTAGSFFKNPIISRELADSLAARFVGLPVFPQENNTAKISLAWLLDHALGLKGFSRGNVRLYERQPIVIVASTGATATEVDSFAEEIKKRVYEGTSIMIEREVETFGV